MPNNRRKGKRIERWFANKLKDIFPDVRRNAGTQSQSGGVDLENTGNFNIEVKGGKSYCYRGVRDMLLQVKKEGKEENLDVVLVKPHREEAYALIPFEDFKEILNQLKAEGVI